MKRLVLAILLPALVACETPPPPPAPSPAPPQAATRRPAARPVQPSRTQATAPAAQQPAQASAAAPEAEALAQPTGSQATPAAAWRVRADGVVGCGDAAGLRLLAELKANAAASPRLVAQAHRDGKCMTAFANRRWTLEQEQGDLVRLRLLDGGTSLYFRRADVVATE